MGRYVMGYSSNSANSSEFPILFVVSPTGQVVFRAAQDEVPGVGRRVASMFIVPGLSESPSKLVFVGTEQSLLEASREAANRGPRVMIGTVDLMVGDVPSFEGFGGTVGAASAGANGDDSAAGTSERSAKSPTNIYLLVGVGCCGCVVVIVAVTTIIAFQQKTSSLRHQTDPGIALVPAVMQ
jgi:hypothetical protein